MQRIAAQWLFPETILICVEALYLRKVLFLPINTFFRISQIHDKTNQDKYYHDKRTW